jgi:hypothetical protein
MTITRGSEERVRRSRNAGVTRFWWPLVLCAVVFYGGPLLGHHSFSQYYLEKDTVEIEGEIVEFQYKNPHSWIQVLGRETFGRPKTYAAEWVGTSQLERLGITKRTLRAGDSVRMWVSPNRDPNDNRVRLKRIERPSDGWQWGQGGRENR